VTRLLRALPLLALAACASGAEGGASPPRQEIEILPAPSSSSATLALLRALPKEPERSARGHWYASEEEAVDLARAEQRPLLIDFAAAWCIACKELETRTYPAVTQELHRFVLLRIDASDSDAPEVARLLSRYKVVGLPAVLLFDAKGNEVERIDRFVEVGPMRDALLRVP
jgi:thiol:disulfide interchange protein